MVAHRRPRPGRTTTSRPGVPRPPTSAAGSTDLLGAGLLLALLAVPMLLIALAVRMERPRSGAVPAGAGRAWAGAGSRC